MVVDVSSKRDSRFCLTLRIEKNNLYKRVLAFLKFFPNFYYIYVCNLPWLWL